MSRKRSLIEFSYAHNEDEEWTTLAVTSREMLAVERSVKGFTAQSFFGSVTISGLYRVAHVALRLRGDVEATMTFDQFVEAYDVKFGPAATDQPDGDTDSEDEDDEPGTPADPTQPAA